MNLDKAFEGRGQPVSFEEARCELIAHGHNDAVLCANGKSLRVGWAGGTSGEVLPLNSKAILEWLGY